MTHLCTPRSCLTLLALLGACAEPQSKPPQVPNNDVQPPVTTTGNGEVMGADGVSPGEKLETGPKLDAEHGLKPAAKPATE